MGNDQWTYFMLVQRMSLSHIHISLCMSLWVHHNPVEIQFGGMRHETFGYFKNGKKNYDMPCLRTRFQHFVQSRLCRPTCMIYRDMVDTYKFD